MNITPFPGRKLMIAGVEAEQALLGAVAQNLDRMDDRLSAGSFGEPVHQRLYAAMQKLRGEDPAPEAVLPLLANRMKDDPTFRALGGPAYLTDLLDRAPTDGKIGHLAREIAASALDRFDALARVETGELPEDVADYIADRRVQIEGLTWGKWKVLDPAAWEGAPVPLREWAWRDLILASSATYLTGAGSAGKSLLGQQLSTHVALGRPFLGAETRQGVALYVTCEDDAQELHRRQLAICEGLDVDLPALSGRLHLISLAGQSRNELAVFDQLGRMNVTAAWQSLRAAVRETKATFVVLDNVAHLFAGNENIRNHVAAFCSLMNTLAMEADAAVLFIGHPNKAGDSFSGSTAWENQVRSRLFLERPKTAEGDVQDPDARVLRREKANYARHGEEIAFRWYRGAFVGADDLSAPAALQDATSRFRSEEERFLECLAKASEERRAVSANKPASNYAPRVFAKMPTARGMTVSAFERALERLLHQGTVMAEQPVFRRPNRSWVTGLQVHQPCTNPDAPSVDGDAPTRTKAI